MRILKGVIIGIIGIALLYFCERVTGLPIFQIAGLVIFIVFIALKLGFLLS